MAKQSSYRS